MSTLSGYSIVIAANNHIEVWNGLSMGLEEAYIEVLYFPLVIRHVKVGCSVLQPCYPIFQLAVVQAINHQNFAVSIATLIQTDSLLIII